MTTLSTNVRLGRGDRSAPSFLANVRTVAGRELRDAIGSRWFVLYTAAFTVLGLRILRSGYLGGNELSARMQAKAGYEIAGIIPGEYWKRGAYHDHVMTFLTRERWLSLSGGNKSWKA